MTTKVTRPVHRETVVGGVLSLGKVRPVIVSIEPPGVVGFRLKGLRKTYRLTAEALFWHAMQAELALEKKEKRKVKRKGKRTVKRGICG